ncbi:serine hydrolase domain-containing protein [Pedobacter xixiisoli]|uniref:CubicO group peptidase, beta-lactamase class C family n=1 Tax=Pedobacter xixiisoli TaxID=1476464 RepID=A0A285ZZU4_9SPHI|nr:serine hydrolase domain-containing protein [Pedobacter xixiisoli]SOD15160.1 CubicO group peptidase, beta-lactamase class C family [Pedobacter xixiisoli]
MIRHYLAFILLFSSTLLCAQQIDTAKLNAYFDTLAKHDKFMGSVAFSKKGQILYQKTIGFADVAQAKKATNESIYRVGSISKTFTAVLVMKAIEEKRLRLEQSLETFFPNLPNASKITLADLLGHRSGIADFTDQADYLTWNTEPKSEKEMLAIITRGGSDFEPRSKTGYSNSNYVLLTYLLEKTYGKTFAFILQQKICKPIGLRSTYVGATIDMQKQEVKSYSYNNGWQLSSETDMSIPLGSGAIVSNTTDLLRFAHALFNKQLISTESLALMQNMQEGIGLGLFAIPFEEKISYGHRGGIDKFTAVFSHFPKEDITFALTANGSNYNGNEIPLTVLNAIFGKDFEVPNFTTYALEPTALVQYIGTYSSTKLPFKISISSNGQQLVAQADGQSAMPFEAVSKDQFRFDKAGINLIFHPAEQTMLLKQGSGEFLFKKQ